VAEKICFVISPIGKDGSEIREWSDTVFEYIIKPVVIKHNYTPIRADHIEKSGMVTSQIIDMLMNADLVVADLTDRNPNVAYELAIRHIVQKPCIEMIKSGQELPFDYHGMRTIYFDTGIRSANKAMTDLDNYIKSNTGAKYKPNNPITQAKTALQIQHRLESNDFTNEPLNKVVLQAINELNSTVYDMKEEMYRLKQTNNNEIPSGWVINSNQTQGGWSFQDERTKNQVKNKIDDLMIQRFNLIEQIEKEKDKMIIVNLEDELMEIEKDISDFQKISNGKTIVLQPKKTIKT